MCGWVSELIFCYKEKFKKEKTNPSVERVLEIWVELLFSFFNDDHQRYTVFRKFDIITGV